MVTAMSSELQEEMINRFNDVLCNLRADKQVFSLIINVVFAVSLCHVTSFILRKSGMEMSQLSLLPKFKGIDSEICDVFRGFRLYKSVYSN